MDVRDNFINLNRWGTSRPCRNCLPNFNTLRQSPPKNRFGIAVIVALNALTGKYIRYCLSCRTEFE